VQSLTEERFQTVVSKINAVWNRSPEKNIRSEPQAQPTGVSKHSPESKRSLEPLSRKEMQAQFAVKNRFAVSNSSPKQNRSVATQKVTSKNSLCRFCIGAVTPTELTLRQSHNRCTYPYPKAKLQCFGGCWSRCYIPHWRRLLYILYHVWMFLCPKNDITQPVCRRRVNSTPMVSAENIPVALSIDSVFTL